MSQKSSNGTSVDSRPRYKIAALMLFSVYLLIILSTSVAMIHNSPLNTITSQNDSSDAFSDASLKLQEADKHPGLTFGEVDKPVQTQTRMLMGYIIISIPFSILVLFLASTILAGFYYLPKFLEEYSNSPALLTFGLSMAFYGLSVVLILEIVPDVHFITSNWNRKSVLWAVLNGRLTPLFVLLIFFQSIIVNCIPFLWTRPIMPNYYNRYSNQNQALMIHLDNWRKYGSWMATVFGGIILTSVLVFLTDISLFGSLFVQHSLILIGGVVVLNLAFVVFKLQSIERRIAGL